MLEFDFRKGVGTLKNVGEKAASRMYKVHSELNEYTKHVGTV